MSARRRWRAGAALAGTASVAVVALLALPADPPGAPTPTRVGTDRTTVPEAAVEASAPAPVQERTTRPRTPASSAGESRPSRSGTPTTNSSVPASSKSAAPAPSASPPPDARVKLLVSGSRGGLVIAPDGSSRSVRLPNYLGFRWSPDGRYVLVARENRIEVTDLETGTWRTVFPGTSGDSAAGGAAWMPDSRTVVFSRSKPKDVIYRESSTWTVDIETGALRHLRDAVEGDGGDYSVTRDGRIVYRCDRESAQLCLLDPSGADLGPLPDSRAGWAFEVSPDGRWVAYVDNDNDNNYFVNVARTDGSMHRRLGRRADVRRPGWYGDSSRVVWGLQLASKEPQPCSSPPPCPNQGGVWSVRLDGSDPRQHPGTVDKDQLIGVVAA